MRSAISSNGFEMPRISEMPPHPPCGGQQSDDTDHEIESMEPVFQSLILIPLLTEDLADISEAQTPWERSQKGVDDEPPKVHPGDSGRKCDKGPDDGKQPARKDNQFSTAFEPAVGDIEIVQRNQDITAIFLDYRTAAIHTDPIRHKRSHYAPDCAGH